MVQEARRGLIVVHHLNNSRSQRLLWLLEELGVLYDIKRYERDRRTMLAPPELRKVHPLGKSPVITDGDVTLAESGAIMEYVIDKYGRGRLVPKPGSPEKLRYLYWMHFAEGSAMPPLLIKLVLDRMMKAPLLVRPVAKAIASKVRKGQPRSAAENVVGGATLTFDLGPSHPHREEVLGLLRSVRASVNDLWSRVQEHNDGHPIPDEERTEVSFYFGQCVTGPDDE